MGRKFFRSMCRGFRPCETASIRQVGVYFIIYFYHIISYQSSMPKILTEYIRTVLYSSQQINTQIMTHFTSIFDIYEAYNG